MKLRVLTLGVLVLAASSGGCKGTPPERPTGTPAPSRPNYDGLDAEQQCYAAIVEYGDPDPPQHCLWGESPTGAPWCPPWAQCNKTGALRIVPNTMTDGQQPTGFGGYFYVLFGERPNDNNSAHRLFCERFFGKVPTSNAKAVSQHVVTLWPTTGPIPWENNTSTLCSHLLMFYDYERSRSITDRLEPCMRPNGRNEVAIVGLESGQRITPELADLSTAWGIILRGDDPVQVTAALTHWFDEVQDARKAGWFEALKARLGDSLESIVKTVRGKECL